MWFEYLQAISHKHRNYCSFFTLHFWWPRHIAQECDIIVAVFQFFFFFFFDCEFCVRKLLWS